MLKDYKTIREVVGPLMLVDQVEGVKYDELVEIKDSTLRKLRSNVFRMLKEAALLSVGGRIMPALLSARISVALSSHTPSDLRFFPIRPMAGEVTAL